MRKDIFLVEDEPDLSQVLKVYLEQAGYTVCSCGTLKQARAHLDQKGALWVLDLMLPDGNGLELLKELKQVDPDSKVIIISAKGDRFDRVAGFEVGCDDYIAKPFLPAELIYRLGKLRTAPEVNEQEPTLLHEAAYEIDTVRRMIFQGQDRIDVTNREFDLVMKFIRNKQQALSRSQIMDDVWGSGYYANDRVVDNYVKNIRRKLPNLPIETIYGYGYRYNG